MNKIFHFILISVILICIGVASSPKADAQSALELIFEGSFVARNIHWSRDSTRLVYQDGLFYEGSPDYGVVSHTQNWYTFSVYDKSFVQTDIWPLQPYLTVDQIEKYSVATLDDQISFLFPSPNGRYIIYAAEQPIDWTLYYKYYPLGILDLQTRQHRVLEDIIVNELEIFTYGNKSSYDVVWSADSHSVLVRTAGYDELPFYVTGLEDGIETIEYISLYREGVDIGEEDVTAWYAFDISNDGKSLLLANIVGYETRLFYWNANQPAQSKIIHAGENRDAAFVPHDESQIVYLDSKGLYHFDLRTEEVTLLMSFEELAAGPSWAWISPDTRYVVIGTRPGNAPDRLYLIDVVALLGN